MERVEIEQVIDGDSVKLSDGQQLRLIGVNTPEIKTSDPLAKEAGHYLRQLLKSGTAYLRKGEQKKDRYGRMLAHLYLDDGKNVEALMLEQGLGFLVAIPPNLSLLPCQKAVRDKARVNKAGVWGLAEYSGISSHHFKADDAGFSRVVGRLESITQSKKHWWLQLDGLVVLRIAKKDQSAFDLDALKAMQGKKILASGWVIDRNSSGVVNKGFSPFMMLLTHPVHVELQ